MTAPPGPRRTRWEDEGARIAEQLRDASAVLVVGTDAEHAALVALGIARVESERRHVALGDLVGDLAPLYAVAGGEDAFGLSDCLRQGLPLDDIARPAPERASLLILPAGSPPVACEEILAHERWAKLVNGFAKAGALLLLVAPLGAPGFASLAAAAGGVVLVEVPAARARNLTVLATVDAPAPAAAPTRARAPRGGRGMLAAGAVLLLALAVAAWLERAKISALMHRSPPERSGAAAPPATAATASTQLARDPAPADTVRLTDPVNPTDTSVTAPFAVEVMAANTLAGANSFLASNSKSSSLTGATISPVTVGGSASVWYKVVVGATHVRAGADSLLAALRRERLVRSGEGRVVKVPYALLLNPNVEAAEVPARVRSWQERGFNAYGLVQKDGSVRLVAGAFETPAQAAPMASALRALGTAPVLAFRTGRTY